MDVRDFDFDLPPELIAQEPPASRGGARLLHLGRDSGSIAHTHVSVLPDLLRAGDLVVVNNTRVFPARLLGRRVPSGGAVECLLIRSLPRADQVAIKSDPSPTPIRPRKVYDHHFTMLRPALIGFVFHGKSPLFQLTPCDRETGRA
jgi:S-adenosylmethionine:tRNA ribosyltransferase-isomerase